MKIHSYLRDFGSAASARVSSTFDAWLKDAATAPPETRARLLTEWTSAPGARHAHPREEHLLPLMVVAGAAGDDVGRVTFNDEWMHTRISAFRYG